MGFGEKFQADIERTRKAFDLGDAKFWRARKYRWAKVRILLTEGDTIRPSAWRAQLSAGLKALGLKARV